MPTAKATADVVRPRLAVLDLLRLAAILLVLGRHMETPPADWPQIPRTIASLWARCGWVGVDLFFVLSGFLISGLLFNEYRAHGRLNLLRFYVRRGWKIYPPFFALIVVTLLVTQLRTGTVPLRRMLAEALFVQNYFPGLWSHTWSLAVEEHFYILLPLVLIVLSRRSPRSQAFHGIPFMMLLLGTLCLGLRIANALSRGGYNHDTHLFPTHLRLDSLFFGVLISYLYHFHREGFLATVMPRRALLIAGGLILFLPAILFPLETTPIVYTVGLTLFYIASGLLLVGTLLFPIPDKPVVTACAAVGSYSYSIYLWHLAVKSWGPPLLRRLTGVTIDYETRLIVYFVGSLVFGVVMSKLIETPMLRLRDRLFPAPAASSP